MSTPKLFVHIARAAAFFVMIMTFVFGIRGFLWLATLFAAADELLLFAVLFAMAVILLSIVGLFGWYAYNIFKLERWTVVPTVLFAVTAGIYLLLQVGGYGYLAWDAVALAVIVVGFGVFSLVFRKYFTRNRRARVATTFLCLLTMPVLTFGVANLTLHDDATINDSDLLLAPQPIIAPETNIHFALPIEDEFTQAESQLFEAALEVARIDIDSEEFDLAVSRNAVASTRFVTDTFIVATNRDDYQCSTSVNSYNFETESCPINIVRDLGVLTALRAYVAAVDGDTTDALESIEANVKMAFQLQQEYSMIEQLVSIAIYNLTVDTLEQLDLTAFSPSQSATLKSILTQFEPNVSRLTNAFRAEYMSSKKMFHAVQVGESKTIYDFETIINPYYFQIHRTLHTQADVARLYIQMADLSCEETRDDLEAEGLAMWEQFDNFPSPIDYLRPNFVGNVLNMITIGSMNNPANNFCEIEQRYKAVVQPLTEAS